MELLLKFLLLLNGWRLRRRLLSFLLALNFLKATLEKLCFFEKG
jgi:hypothetical protein